MLAVMYLLSKCMSVHTFLLLIYFDEMAEKGEYFLSLLLSPNTLEWLFTHVGNMSTKELFWEKLQKFYIRNKSGIPLPVMTEYLIIRSTILPETIKNTKKKKF